MKQGRIDISQQTVTMEMITPLFEDMKAFVRSTIKANNVVIKKELRNEIRGDIKEEVIPLKSGLKQLQVAVMENRKEIKKVEKELRAEIKGVKEDVKEVKEDMRGMEERLGNKIDKNAIRLGDHETRITTLEASR